MTTAELNAAWAPLDQALALLDHRQRATAAAQRERVRMDRLRAEWDALTPDEQTAIRDGERTWPHEYLPEGVAA